MNNLFLTIILIVYIFLTFRYFKKFKINSFHAIVVNYYACILTGILFLNDLSFLEDMSINVSWVRFGIIAGTFFVPCFYLMGLVVEKVNITVSVVANKMSLVVPVIFSMLFIKKGPDTTSTINIAGILLALLAIVLTTANDEKKLASGIRKKDLILLPAALFLLGGLIDTIINYTSYVHLKEQNHGVFPLVMFATAALTGTAVIVYQMIFCKTVITLKDIIGGFALGIPNYFSLYFLLKTMADFNHDAAVVFPVLNIGTIVVASLAAVFLFNEKLTKINLIGICFSVISIILIFW